MNSKTEVCEVEDLKLIEHVFQFKTFNEVAEIKRIVRSHYSVEFLFPLVIFVKALYKTYRNLIYLLSQI